MKSIFIAQNINYFPKEHRHIIIEKINSLSEDRMNYLYSVSIRKPINWCLLYIFCPLFFCLDRIILNRDIWGLLKAIIGILMVIFVFIPNAFSNMPGYNELSYAITIGAIWIMIDFFTLSGRVRKSNAEDLSVFFENSINPIKNKP